MPIYEFRCDECQGVFEHLALNTSDEICCPHCGGQTLTKLMSAANCQVDTGVSAAGGASGGPTIENRSCGDAGNCGTITLPGYTR